MCPNFAGCQHSVGAVKDTRLDVAGAFLKLLGSRLAEGATLPPSLINVNIPNEPLDRIEGVQITRLGARSYGESVTEGNDGVRKYYWVSKDRPIAREQPADTDIWALQHNRISITPIHTGLTDVGQMPTVEAVFQGYSRQLLGRTE